MGFSSVLKNSRPKFSGWVFLISLLHVVAIDHRLLGQEQPARRSERVDLGSVNALAFSPNGKILAVAHEGGFRLRYLTTGKELVRADRRGTFAVAFSSDGKTVAMGMADGTIRLWPTDAEVESGKLTGHKEGVTTVAFAADGKILASGSYDGTICFWDPVAQKKVRTIRVNEEGVTSIAFSPDGKTLASGGIATTEVTINTNYAPVTQADAVRLWDVAGGKEVRKLKGRGSIVAFSSDGKRLACGGLTAIFHLNSKPEESYGIHSRGSTGGKIQSNTSLGSGMQIDAISIQAYHMVRLWDPATGKEVSSRELRRSRNVGNAIAFSHEGARLAAGSGPVIDFRSTRGGNLISTQKGRMQISLWEASAGKPIRKLNGEARAVAFSPDGKTLATGGLKGTITLWDVDKLVEQKPEKDAILADSALEAKD
jgi:WD40 repeat protein